MNEIEYRFSDTYTEVRFSDLDASGHLNHATVLKYVEQARVLYYQNVLGMNLPQDLMSWVLAEILVSYRQPGRFNDRIRVWLRIPWMRKSSAGWDFRLTRVGDDALIAEGRGVHVHVDVATGKASEIPSHWRKRIVDFEPVLADGPSPS